MSDTQLTQYALINFKPLTGFDAQNNIKAVVIENNHIIAAGDIDCIPTGYKTIDLQGLTLTPGFIDLQINGCGGVLFNGDISAHTLDVMHQTNLRHGCTTFLPTLITSSDDDIRQAIKVISDYQQQHPDRVPGVHLEGPWISLTRKGIHNTDFVRAPDTKMVQFLCDHASIITMITVAPEVCPINVIEQLSAAGIVVSLGHSDATCAQAKAAVKAGATFATHLHNAMSPLTSREPGVVGAVFDSTLGAGIIADGHHLTWENLRIAQAIMQDRLVLVTDASTPAGTDMATFEFAGQTIYHQDGRCQNADGTLAGSALTMIEAVNNTIQAGIDAQTAIRMATANAAKAIHQEQQLGSIATGQFANLVVLNDQMQVQSVVSGGELIRYQQ